MNGALSFILSGALVAATPLLIAALGELVAEKSGVLNLGIEGMMAIGAVIAFITVHQQGSHWLALLTAGLAGLALSMVFAVLVLQFLANQVAAGISLGLLGLGLSAFVGRRFESLTVEPMAKIHLPVLSDLPLVGPLVFGQSPPVYLAPLVGLAIWWFLRSTKAGLVVRAVGETPEAAHALGYSVVAVRYATIAFGGFMAGIAGGYMSTVYSNLWADGMIAGRGWIVVALVVFGTWRVGRIAAGAYLFGITAILELSLQSLGVAVPSQLLASLPYLVTIIALALLSMEERRVRLNAPVALGQVYRAEH